MRRLRLTAGSILCAATLAACGGGGDDPDAVAAWCRQADRTMDAVREVRRIVNSDDLEGLDAAGDEMRDQIDRLVATAPDSIADDVAAAFPSGDDPDDGDENAGDRVDRYIAENCD